ncbi:MAG: ArsR/SmtB family transcription factor [Ignavibacteriales bacterium]
MVDIFKALAEENRLRILSLLMVDDLCVCEIESVLNMTQSNVSRHLTTLKQCGILRNYKNAQWTYYCINDSFKEENKELYQYLIKRLKELPSYEEDNDKFLKCRQEDVCNNSKNIN